MTPASRPLFGLERVWLAADAVCPPFAFLLVFEGHGTLDADAWVKAISTCAAAWPGARARLSGVLGWTRWVADGPLPPVDVVDGQTWDGRSAPPFGLPKLDPWAGPVLSVTLAEGPTPRVVVCCHHAALDGRGLWQLIEDLGAALRGEPLRGAAFAGLDDTEIVGPGPTLAEPPPDAPLPTGRADGDTPGWVWTRRTLPHPPDHTLGRLLVALARLTPDHPARVSVPVDLRRFAPQPRVCGNLTGLLRVEVRADDDPAAIAAALRTRVASGEAAGPIRTAERLRALPLSVLRGAGRLAERRLLREGAAPVSATVTNLGKVDPAVISGAGFSARRVFLVPTPGPGMPLFVGLAGHPEGLEVVAHMPASLASGGRMDALVAGLDL